MSDYPSYPIPFPEYEPDMKNWDNMSKYFLSVGGEMIEYKLNVPLVDELIEWIELNIEAQEAIGWSDLAAGVADKELDGEQVSELLRGKPMHDQGMWHHIIKEYTPSGATKECGTSCCVAGYIGQVTKSIKMFAETNDMNPDVDMLLTQSNHMDMSWTDWKEGHSWMVESTYTIRFGVPWQWMGSFHLGLPIAVVEDLFAASNSPRDLLKMFAELKRLFG